MYAKGMTNQNISARLRDVYGVAASAEMISRMTDRILPLAENIMIVSIDGLKGFEDAIHAVFLKAEI